MHEEDFTGMNDDGSFGAALDIASVRLTDHDNWSYFSMMSETKREALLQELQGNGEDIDSPVREVIVFFKESIPEDDDDE